MTKKKKNVPTFRRQNITNALFQKWQQLRRKNDAQAIRDFIKTVGGKDFSISTINNALGYGFVHSDELQDAITAFFINRENGQQEDVLKLTKNAEDQTV